MYTSYKRKLQDKNSISVDDNDDNNDDDNNVVLKKNHIYFYSDVTQKSCLRLNQIIRNLNTELSQFIIEYNCKPPNIYLHINSSGGSLLSAFSTIDTIKNSKIPIISIIEGFAASAATIISIVCHKRYCTENSLMLIHQLSSKYTGKYEEIKDEFTNDTQLMTVIYKLYREHTTMKLKAIKKVLKGNLWWDINKCIQNGLVDEIWKDNNITITIDDNNNLKNKRKKIQNQ